MQRKNRRAQRSPLAGRDSSFPVTRVLATLRRAAPGWNAPVGVLALDRARDPFRVLVGCLLSLRTKDEVTHLARDRLFALAQTPREISRLPPRRLEQAIYPVGFYRVKARTLRRVCLDLLERFDGAVPEDLETLLTLKGVGRKTANLVLAQGFGKPGICVDTHVHRISNRWGYVQTKDPHATELALRERLPRRHWIEYNQLLVAFGQTLCKPTSPLCSRCPVARHCAKRGVVRQR